MKTAHENRHANLLVILKDMTIVELAAASGCSGPNLSHIKNGKNMGDKIARMIEDGLDYPHGWMDADHSPSLNDAMEQAESIILEQAKKIADSSVSEDEAFYGLLELLRRRRHNEKDGILDRILRATPDPRRHATAISNIEEAQSKRSKLEENAK